MQRTLDRQRRLGLGGVSGCWPGLFWCLVHGTEEVSFSLDYACAVLYTMVVHNFLHCPAEIIVHPSLTCGTADEQWLVELAGKL